MLDLISLLWTVLRDCGITLWVITIIVVLLVCIHLLVKEFGRTFIGHLLHRRNLLSICGILLYFCAFLLLFFTGVFICFPVILRVLSILFYALYIAVTLCSVQGPVLFSGHYLKQHTRWLKQDQAHEHRTILTKMPWYFFDVNEKIGYQILKGKYLFKQGDIYRAYEVMSAIDQKLLYPEEISNLTIDLVYMLQQMGNLKKAEILTNTIQSTNLPAYGFFKSCLSELRGDSESAWRYARESENAVGTKRKDARILASLYTQLGRLSFFRNNMTEMFRYYHLALEQAKEFGDVRLLHTAYQNLLNQIQIQNMYTEEKEQLMQEYIGVVAVASLNSLLEFENFRVGLARQSNDKDAEYKEIMNGYRLLHKITVPPERYSIEVSTLKMLNNGKYDVSEVLADIEKHFDAYFTLPLPARFIILQELTCPPTLTAEQAMLYERWTPKLIEYAQNQAMADLNEYERSLSSDCVHERCWVILQRSDFTRRGSEQYDGLQVLQWMWDIVQIYQDSGQLFKEVEARINILKQYDEMILLNQLTPDTTTLDKMRKIIKEAYTKSKLLPTQTVGYLLINIAFFSEKLGDMDQAKEAINSFCSLRVSSHHLSQELQQKLSAMEQLIPLSNKINHNSAQACSARENR